MDAGAPHAASAAQLQRDLQTAAAHQAVGFTQRRVERRRRRGRPRRASASARRAAPRRSRARSSAPTARRRCASRPEPLDDREQRYAMRILVIGGGVFLGAAIVDSALARGHAITVFNRGRARSDWPDGVEAIVGDRSSDLGLLRGRELRRRRRHLRLRPRRRARQRRRARVVRALLLRLEHLGLRVVHARAGARERSARRQRRHRRGRPRPRAPLRAAEGGVRARRRGGVRRARADRAARAHRRPARPHRPLQPLAVARAGRRRDPGARHRRRRADPADRRARPRRLDRPRARERARAAPTTRPVRRTGAPAAGRELLEACIDAARRRGGSPLRFVPVGEAFLLEQGVAPWSELPLWVPSSDPRSRSASSRIDCSRAVAAGLVTRPLAETVDAVLDEFAGARRRRPAPRAAS